MNTLPRLVLVLTLITAGAGLLLSLVESVTREPIAEQRRLEMLRALKAVLPPADNSPDEDTVQLLVGKDKRGRDVLRKFFRGRKEGQLSGIAFKVVAPDGYSGNIDIMVGIDPAGTVVGIDADDDRDAQNGDAREDDPRNHRRRGHHQQRYE